MAVAAAWASTPRSSTTYTGASVAAGNSFGTAVLGAPTSAGATAGDGSASVTWSAPTTGAAAVAGYVATAAPGGATCTTGAATFTCTITGITNGVSYTVSVAATSGNWVGPSASAGTVTPYPATIMSGSTLNLWLDGADGTTLRTSSTCAGATATTGQTVGCWRDKSASANHAIQSTLSQRPAVSAVAGRSAPMFDGTDDYAALDVHKLVGGTNPSAIFVVAVQEDPAPASSGWRHAIAWGSAATAQARIVEKANYSALVAFETYDTWASMSPARSWPTSSAALVDGVITSTSVVSYRDGVLNATYSGSANTGTASGATLGTAPWSLSGVWMGRIAEVIVLASAPTATQVRTVREYLSRKWAVAVTPASAQSPAASVVGATATVTWSAPAYDGGSAVTSYTVTPTAGPGSCTWSSGTTASCSGLTGGPYTFRVAATNAVGTGPYATTP